MSRPKKRESAPAEKLTGCRPRRGPAACTPREARRFSVEEYREAARGLHAEGLCGPTRDGLHFAVREEVWQLAALMRAEGLERQARALEDAALAELEALKVESDRRVAAVFDAATAGEGYEAFLALQRKLELEAPEQPALDPVLGELGPLLASARRELGPRRVLELVAGAEPDGGVEP